MKSKVKVKRDEKLGRTFIDFFKLKDKDKKDYRFDVLNILLRDQDLLVMINTNLCCTVDNSVPRDNIRVIEKYVKDKGFKNIVIPIENTNKKSVFGFSIGTKNKNTSYKLGFIMPKGNFDRELYEDLFNIYDIEIGVGLIKDEEEILEDFRKGYFDSLFNKEYFRNSVYVGIMFDKIITDLEFDFDEIANLSNAK
ncbi:hypothetical protein SH1V18_27280 [Vallitalea longa]|uniref:Uncharacterized protein n=1 Tax=Vallitalea longa TaxID=2936439 RepID=A0A9W5YDA0_9FIRM|nr:hypothetical protein [Vallitalea longa]GKX30248.1 hypothetical protein SH1V18_27280 [Vallitalea longa]